jgi:hypothetical protein
MQEGKKEEKKKEGLDFQHPPQLMNHREELHAGMVGMEFLEFWIVDHELEVLFALDLLRGEVKVCEMCLFQWLGLGGGRGGGPGALDRLSTLGMLLKAVVLGVTGLVTVAADCEPLLSVRAHVDLLVGGKEGLRRVCRRGLVQVVLRDMFLQTRDKHCNHVVGASNTDDIPE